MIPDVLILSKINSDLLHISPIPVTVIVLVKDALKMFAGELRTADIRLETLDDSSLRQLEGSWLLLDPGRVLQVLINLLNNAIKVTRTEPTRTIQVMISVSLSRPSKTDSDIEYVPQRGQRDSEEPTDPSDDSIYLSFSVRDTDISLSPEENKVFFNRFSQGSPKSHVKDCGSDLGLFISHQLSEMQGEEIGIASKSGKGSYFRLLRQNEASYNTTATATTEQEIETTQPQSFHCRLHRADQSGKQGRGRVGRGRVDHSKNPLQRPLSALKILVVEDNVVN